MKLTILTLCAAALIFGQAAPPVPSASDPTKPRYQVNATTTKVTLQGYGSNDPAFMETLVVTCASAATLTTSWNGTAATATTGTAIKLPGSGPLARPVNVFTGSDVGSGTTGAVTTIAAGVSFPIDVTMFMVNGNSGTGTNLTFTTNSSCTFQITFRTVY
jgi:hypothetical protein